MKSAEAIKSYRKRSKSHHFTNVGLQRDLDKIYDLGPPYYFKWSGLVNLSLQQRMLHKNMT